MLSRASLPVLDSSAKRSMISFPPEEGFSQVTQCVNSTDHSGEEKLGMGSLETTLTTFLKYDIVY